MRGPSDEAPPAPVPSPAGGAPGGRTPPGHPTAFVDSQYPTPPRGQSAALRAPTPLANITASGDLPPGTILGKYQIVQRLGVGGMGSVYEAIHTGIAKAVALKTMSPQLAADNRAAARFMREAASASRLDHPHVVGVTDFGTDRGISYLVMELLRGEDLGQVITRESSGVDPVLVADVMLAVCAGVFAAHESGVVHRDLKPPNIFLSRTPLGETVPKVLDFGISKVLSDDVNAPLTNTGMVMGTTHYLSPEQVGGKGVDARSDQYSLGVIMYEALTGRRPHGGNSVYEIMRSISEGNFSPPRKLRTDLPPALEAVVLRAMATRPQDRFESVHGLGRALLPLASQKRRVIWNDYYDRNRSNAARVAGDARALGAGAPEPNGTVVMNVVRPAALSATRTHFIPEEMKEVVKARIAETRIAHRSDFPELRQRTAGGKSKSTRLVIALAAAATIAGGIVLWRVPQLRAQLPATVRATLERGLAAAANARKADPKKSAPESGESGSTAGAPASPAVARVPQGRVNRRPTPFTGTALNPFDPPSTPPVSAVAAKAAAGAAPAGPPLAGTAPVATVGAAGAGAAAGGAGGTSGVSSAPAGNTAAVGKPETLGPESTKVTASTLPSESAGATKGTERGATAAAAAATGAGRSGIRRDGAGRFAGVTTPPAVAPKGKKKRAAPIYSPVLPTNTPSTTPANPPPQPPAEVPVPAPEQITPRRYFNPGLAPILE